MTNSGLAGCYVEYVHLSIICCFTMPFTDVAFCRQPDGGRSVLFSLFQENLYLSHKEARGFP